MSQQIVKPHQFQAFRERTKPKREPRRMVDDKHLAFIRSLPCLASDYSCLGDIEAHHLLGLPDNSRGGALKAGDRWTIPLCRAHHGDLHMNGERKFLDWHGIAYPPALAALLYQLSGNETACLRVIAEMKS